MADAIEVAIQSALINHLKALLTSPAFPLSLPNINFTQPTAGPNVFWYRATFLPATSFALGVAFDSANQHYGIFQVDVFYGQGSGELAPGRIAAGVIGHFDRGTVVTKDGFSARVTLKPYRSAMVKSDPWMMIPVSVPYLSFS